MLFHSTRTSGSTWCTAYSPSLFTTNWQLNGNAKCDEPRNSVRTEKKQRLTWPAETAPYCILGGSSSWLDETVRDNRRYSVFRHLPMHFHRGARNSCWWGGYSCACDFLVPLRWCRVRETIPIPVATTRNKTMQCAIYSINQSIRQSSKSLWSVNQSVDVVFRWVGPLFPHPSELFPHEIHTECETMSEPLWRETNPVSTQRLSARLSPYA